MTRDGKFVAFCQKWKSKTTGEYKAFSLHVTKTGWSQFVGFVRMNTSYWEGGIKTAGLLNLIPDGNPYWCEISQKLHKEITNRLGQRFGLSSGLVFNGPAPLPRYILKWRGALREEEKVIGEDKPVRLYLVQRGKQAFSSQATAQFVVGEMRAMNENHLASNVEKVVGIPVFRGNDYFLGQERVTALRKLSELERILLGLDKRNWVELQEKALAKLTEREQSLLHIDPIIIQKEGE